MGQGTDATLLCITTKKIIIFSSRPVDSSGNKKVKNIYERIKTKLYLSTNMVSCTKTMTLLEYVIMQKKMAKCDRIFLWLF